MTKHNIWGGCACYECRDTYNTYQRTRRANIKAGTHNPIDHKADIDYYAEELELMLWNGEGLRDSLKRLHPTRKMGSWRVLLYRHGYNDLAALIERTERRERKAQV